MWRASRPGGFHSPIWRETPGYNCMYVCVCLFVYMHTHMSLSSAKYTYNCATHFLTVYPRPMSASTPWQYKGCCIWHISVLGNVHSMEFFMKHLLKKTKQIIYLFIWLHQILVSTCGILHCNTWDLSLWHKGAVVMTNRLSSCSPRGLSCPVAGRILVPQPGVNPRPLHCKVDFYLLDHQQSPTKRIFWKTMT